MNTNLPPFSCAQHSLQVFLQFALTYLLELQYLVQPEHLLSLSTQLPPILIADKRK